MSVELLVVYTQTANEAFEILGDEAGLFGDNGGDPDGPSYYRPTVDVSDEAIDAIVNRRLGHVAVGEEIAYEPDEYREYPSLDGENVKGWCGYQSDKIAYVTYR